MNRERMWDWVGRLFAVLWIGAFIIVLAIMAVVTYRYCARPSPVRGAVLGSPPASYEGTATIRVMDYVPRAFESGSYPTLTPEPEPSNPPAPGYMRYTFFWNERVVESVSYVRHREPEEYVRTVVCTIPGGSSVRDTAVPGGSAREDLIFLGGAPCESNRHEIWSVYRTFEDWTRWIGCSMYSPGEPRSIVVYRAVGEVICIRRTE